LLGGSFGFLLDHAAALRAVLEFDSADFLAVAGH
jgi:hypothetical protein